MIVVEGNNSVHIGGQAWLIEEDREVAWAEPFVKKNPLYAWVLGKYVGTGAPNDNGHIFVAEDLREKKDTLVHAPLNMLHSAHQIMGTFVANELVYPAGESAAAESAPYVEALAAFWKYYFQDEFELIRMAHNEGSLAFSMECIPESVSCAGGCDQTFAYQGRTDDSYCAHLNMPAAKKRLNKPQFSAGALVVPPALPAWKNATVSELSTMVAQELLTAESVYEQTKAELPHLEPAQWESLMGELMLMAARADARA